MDCYESEETSVTHVIFDVDGTILDTESVYNRAKQKVTFCLLCFKTTFFLIVERFTLRPVSILLHGWVNG